MLLSRQIFFNPLLKSLHWGNWTDALSGTHSLVTYRLTRPLYVAAVFRQYARANEKRSETRSRLEALIDTPTRLSAAVRWTSTRWKSVS